MIFFQKKYLFAYLLLLFIIFLFYNTNELGRFMYPIKYKQDIQISAENFDIDPFLIASIIRAESNYNPELESRDKAVGLMQLMPETADWIIIKAGYSLQIKDHLKEADVNIEMGAWYLQWLTLRFKDEFTDDQPIKDKIAVIAAAYNAGHNKLIEWFNEGIWDGQYNTMSQIPYGETRHYIKRVNYYYNKYQTFYTDDWFEIINKEALN